MLMLGTLLAVLQVSDRARVAGRDLRRRSLHIFGRRGARSFTTLCSYETRAQSIDVVVHLSSAMLEPPPVSNFQVDRAAYFVMLEAYSTRRILRSFMVSSVT